MDAGMRIEGIIANYSPAVLRNSAGGARSSKDRPNESTSTRKDSVQISDEARKHLERVRGRIERGFYNSDSVKEEISDKLSGVLNEISA